VNISREWLTDVLRRNGCIVECEVTAIDVQRIGTEVGFLDSLARLILTYDKRESGAPESLVVKVSSAEATYRQIGTFYDAYEREFRFYETIAPTAPIRLPRCFGHEVDSETKAYWLILEDLSLLSAGDQVRGVTRAQAEASVETIGRFHAAWWESANLESLTWMPRRNIQPSRYQAAWPRFRDRFSRHLSTAAIELGEYLAIHLEMLLDEIDGGPRTIVHSDFRADNLLFGGTADRESVVILDWQLAIRSHGALDVARLLCGSMNPRDRAGCDMDLLRKWHTNLELIGVRGYSLQRALEDYKKAALICLYYPVTIHAAEEAAGIRGAALAQAQIERFFTAAVELSDVSIASSSFGTYGRRKG
jgi:aminoglycoside phosphotransferase (APT) family kinase protein